MKPALIINCRNKEKYVSMAVAGALSQTVPCEIVVADFASEDKSRDSIQLAIDTAPRGAEHSVKFLKCDWPTRSIMEDMNKNVTWLWQQTESDWIFQTSADDYDLPDRVKVCMEAVAGNPCSAMETTQYFQEPGVDYTKQSVPVSGFPQESGYVQAGPGLMALAYGSTIGGYSREFLTKVGDCGPNTPDVMWGFLAALDKGFYVVANPQHVHVNVKDVNNTGFQGKMGGAAGDELLRLAELNHFQLMRLYFACADKALELRPDGVPQEHWVPVMNMILGQAKGLLNAREVLHAKQITPGIL